MPAETPLFVKTFDLVQWLMERTAGFAKTTRFTLGQRLCDHALDLLESVVTAHYVKDKLPFLDRADGALRMLHILVRLAEKMKCISVRQYEYASGCLDEIGRMIGGWKKSLK